MKTADWQRLQVFFESNEGREVNAYTEIVINMRILEYTGRITDLRHHFGCVCASGQTCYSDKHIVNTRKGYYKYLSDTTKEIMDTPQDKLADLRQQYVEAKKAGDEVKMKLIEIRGRAVKLAIEKQEALVKKVQTNLFISGLCLLTISSFALK